MLAIPASLGELAADRADASEVLASAAACVGSRVAAAIDCAHSSAALGAGRFPSLAPGPVEAAAGWLPLLAAPAAVALASPAAARAAADGLGVGGGGSVGARRVTGGFTSIGRVTTGGGGGVGWRGRAGDAADVEASDVDAADDGAGGGVVSGRAGDTDEVTAAGVEAGGGVVGGRAGGGVVGGRAGDADVVTAAGVEAGGGVVGGRAGGGLVGGRAGDADEVTAAGVEAGGGAVGGRVGGGVVVGRSNGGVVGERAGGAVGGRGLVLDEGSVPAGVLALWGGRPDAGADDESADDPGWAVDDERAIGVANGGVADGAVASGAPRPETDGSGDGGVASASSPRDLPTPIAAGARGVAGCAGPRDPPDSPDLAGGVNVKLSVSSSSALSSLPGAARGNACESTTRVLAWCALMSTTFVFAS